MLALGGLPLPRLAPKRQPILFISKPSDLVSSLSLHRRLLSCKIQLFTQLENCSQKKSIQ
jgi:hypothetical protein